MCVVLARHTVPFNFLDFKLCVLLKEAFDVKVASADPHIDLVVVYPEVELAFTKLVDTSALANEHNFQLFPLWEVIQELCKPNVKVVVLNGYVESSRDLHLELRNILFLFI